MGHPALAFELCALAGGFGQRIVSGWPSALVGELAIQEELQVHGRAVDLELGINPLMELSQTPDALTLRASNVGFRLV